MDVKIPRRTLLGASGMLMTGSLLGGLQPVALAEQKPDASKGVPFRYCLNTGTIRGQKLSIVQEIEIAAKAGYDAIEPWISSLHKHVQDGGSLADIRKRIGDLGITAESAIGFSVWITDNDEERAKGMESIKKDMDVLAQIGCKRIAAPPAGATDKPGLDLKKAAERYRKLLELGDEMGVVPQLEVWGFSKNVSRLSDAIYIVMETGHRKACMVPDVFHIYKSGFGFDGLRLLSSQAIQVFHLNDYPADPPRETINDSYRVFPGDGVAPLNQIIQDLHASGGDKFLSLELFNQEYWKQDALQVAQTGLAKMKAAVQKALES